MPTVPAFTIGDITVGGGRPFVLMAGPCVIESEAHATTLAIELAQLTGRLGMPFVFKASYDKANRTSGRSFRGPGLTEGLRALAVIKDRVRVPIVTDIHEPSQAAAAANVADVLQIPAFLCRQTDLLVAAAKPDVSSISRRDSFLRQTTSAMQSPKLTGCRQFPRHGDRARNKLRLPRPGRRHAIVPDHARAGPDSRVRRDPQPPASRRR